MTIADQVETGHFSAKVHRGATAFLGVVVTSMGYFRGPSFNAGALIEAVVPASPAEKVGLGYGDVITSLNSESITSATALTNALLAQSPGAKVSLGWVDQFGATHSATVTLASGPPQ